MKDNRFIYYVLALFIAGNLLLAYVQYNSAQNIEKLIGGNELLLQHLQVTTELKELEKDVVSVENKIQTIITLKDTTGIETLERQMDLVKQNLQKLQAVNDNDSTIYYVDILDSLIREKIFFTNNVLRVYASEGPPAAAKLIATSEGKRLTEAITLTANRLENSRNVVLTAITDTIDRSGDRAKHWGTILFILVVVSGICLFWVIVNKVKQLQQLVVQLNASEKKERELAHIKENFLANMSHEIRTPMNAILGFTQLLRKKTPDGDQKEYVDAIHQSGEKLLSIVNEVLDLSKIEAGMMRIEKNPFDITQVVQTLNTMFTSQAREKGLAFSVELDPSIPATLIGDDTRLVQILVNLLGNALKFTDRGQVRLVISARERTESECRLQFVVSDTGIGIAAANLEKIFERFEQAEDSVTRRYGGTGLGLSIVKELVELQKGSISVKSQEGVGTAFTVELPFACPAAEELFTPEYIPALNLEAGQAHLLVAEDNELNQVLLSHFLKDSGFTTDYVATGKAAIEQLKKHRYDLVLMDIQMPEMDGYSATRKIRDELRLDIPIIAMTAKAFPGEREKCLEAGMNEYLSKPIQEEELLRLISSVLHQGHPQNSIFRYIDPTYLYATSEGDTAYEQTILKHFVELITRDSARLRKAIKASDLDSIPPIIHNMRSTVSVLGLDRLIAPLMDELETKPLNLPEAGLKVEELLEICSQAVLEAERKIIE